MRSVAYAKMVRQSRMNSRVPGVILFISEILSLKVRSLSRDAWRDEGGAGYLEGRSESVHLCVSILLQRTAVGTPLSPFVQQVPGEVRRLVDAVARAVCPAGALSDCQAADDSVA